MTKDQKIMRAKVGLLRQSAWGQQRASNELKRRGLSSPPSGSAALGRGMTLKTRKKGLKAPEASVAETGAVFTEAQVVTLEKAKGDKEAHGEFESECLGSCIAQDTFYVGSLKGVGRVYQQTVIDTYSKVAFAKLYDRKTPITAADILNDRVIPFFDGHEVPICRVQTDRGTESCGAPECHDHTRTKARSPQTNGICERFYKTVLDAFYRVAFRKRIYETVEPLRADLDAWMREYNEPPLDPARRGATCQVKSISLHSNPRHRTLSILLKHLTVKATGMDLPHMSANDILTADFILPPKRERIEIAWRV